MLHLSLGADVNLADFQGKTPLYICVNNAVVHSCRSAIVKLLAAGAIVDKLVLIFFRFQSCLSFLKCIYATRVVR
jgi:hypothetical protein